LEDKRLSYFSRAQNKIYKVEHEIPGYIARKTPLNDIKSPFSTLGNSDSVIMHEVFSNNVYNVTKDGLSLRYKWDFGNRNFDFGQLPADRPRDYYRTFFRMDTAQAFYLGGNIEDARFIYADAFYRHVGKTFIYDKKTKSYVVFSRLTDHVVMPLNGNTFLGGITAFVEPRHVKFVANSDLLDDKQKALLSSLPPTSNPIILKFFY